MFFWFSRLLFGFAGEGTQGALPLDPSRDAVPAPCKGVPPLTLSRDWVGDVCIQCPRADPPCARVSFPPQPCWVAGDFLFPKTTKKVPSTLANQGLIGIRQRLILPGRVQPSTFSTGELNFCVRDGNRWNLSVITTGKRLVFTNDCILSRFYCAVKRR